MEMEVHKVNHEYSRAIRWLLSLLKTSFNRALTMLSFCLLALAILSVGIQTAEASDSVSAPTGLVGWWPGDGTTLDVTASANHGTLMNGAAYAPGKVGQAFSFDGVNDDVSVPDNPLLSPHVGATGEMTVMAWIQVPAYPSTGRPFVAKGTSGAWEYALYANPDGSVQFILWSSAGVTYASASGGKINPGQWHHVAGVLKKGQYARLYLDGLQVGEKTSFTGDTADGSSPLYFGRRGDGYYFPGLVDEVALFNRALTTEEVSAVYSAGSLGVAYQVDPSPVVLQQPVSETHYPSEAADFWVAAMGSPRP